MNDSKKPQPPLPETTDDVRFCLNCNDMDDLATSAEAQDVDRIRQRFQACKESGRFDGDLCARLFVADDSIADPSVLDDGDA